ncbi:hypothetical protein V1514DRAFT_337699 [Lipomyces japonicus]|uniref:uncharacterized protein n=1 Tax=Lipomyces japonicus TaxID=56871 RepID=UPI0034CFBE1B
MASFISSPRGGDSPDNNNSAIDSILADQPLGHSTDGQPPRFASAFRSPSPTSSAYNTPQQLSDSPEDEDDEDDDTADDIDDDDTDFKGTSSDAELVGQEADDVEVPVHANLLPTELIISIFGYLDTTEDVKSVLMVCKSWARCAVELLWYRPNFQTIPVFARFVKTLERPESSLMFPYGRFVRKLNLTAISENLTDQVLLSLGQACTELERLTLPSCKRISDESLEPVIRNNTHLTGIDLSQLDRVTDLSIIAISETCKKLQGLNITGCKLITDQSVLQVAHTCRYLRRLKMVDCALITNTAVDAVSTNCNNLMELDLQGCVQIQDNAVTNALNRLPFLREFRVCMNANITNDAFSSFPVDGGVQFDALRLIDLSGCSEINDQSVLRIVLFAPRLRNLILAKCSEITDQGLIYICKLGRSLHYLHLGHCSLITDLGVFQLVRHCSRIRYIDLACCLQLTDVTVQHLATLPKLRRLGLVKCQNVTNVAIQALVQRQGIENSLERVHLSYCANLTLPVSFKLLLCHVV